MIRIRQFDRGIDLDWTRAVSGTNGSYQVYISKRLSQPVLKIEAEGYLPSATTVLPPHLRRPIAWSLAR